MNDDNIPTDGFGDRMEDLRPVDGVTMGHGPLLGTTEAGTDPGINALNKQGQKHGFLSRSAASVSPSAIGVTPYQLAKRRFMKNKLAVASVWLLGFLYLCALFAPFIAPYTFTMQTRRSFAPPSPLHWHNGLVIYGTTSRFNEYHEREFVENHSEVEHVHLFAKGPEYKLFGVIPSSTHLFEVAGAHTVNLLGTDNIGRDYFTRVLYGSQISLSIGIIAITLTFIFALAIGGVSGYYGGIVDDVIMRICEVVMSIPDLYLLLALAAFLPPTIPPVKLFLSICLILSLVGWAGMARVVRGMVLSVREREYVEAARALGVSDAKIIMRHVIPSTLTFTIVAASLSVPAFMLSEAALSFLGVGIRDPVPSWGNLLSAAEDPSIIVDRTWMLVPGLLICVTTLAINVFGDALRDALDPKAK